MSKLRIMKSEGRKKKLTSRLPSQQFRKQQKYYSTVKASRCFATSKEEKLEGGGFLGERFKENEGLDKAHFRKRLSCGKQLFMIQVNCESILQLNSPRRGDLQAEQVYRLPLMLRRQQRLGATTHHARPRRTILLRNPKARSCNWFN